jgi:hypothetical protein
VLRVDAFYICHTAMASATVLGHRPDIRCSRAQSAFPNIATIIAHASSSDSPFQIGP